MVGIPFAIGYAIITYCQWRDLRYNFGADQRPYVASTGHDQAQLAPPDNRLAAHVSYANYGKSPALHVKKEGHIFIGKDALGLANEWFAKIGGAGDLPQTTGEGILIQNQPANNTIVVGSGPASGPDEQYVIAMRFQYRDAADQIYWTDVCFWHLPGMASPNHCIAHNEIH